MSFAELAIGPAASTGSNAIIGVSQTHWAGLRRYDQIGRQEPPAAAPGHRSLGCPRSLDYDTGSPLLPYLPPSFVHLIGNAPPRTGRGEGVDRTGWGMTLRLGFGVLAIALMGVFLTPSVGAGAQETLRAKISPQQVTPTGAPFLVNESIDVCNRGASSPQINVVVRRR